MPRIVDLDPATYQRHAIHQGDRIWAETNCYTDIIIELLHGLGHEPIAALPFTLGIDFELDQWTFFKVPHADIEELYALSIQELAPWRPLVEHIEEQVAAGRPVLVELDSWFLPDTAGTAYRRAHVKTTVAVNEIDRSGRSMGYFHNQGYYRLEGEDFDEILQLAGPPHPRVLPPFIELVKPLPRARALVGAERVDASRGLLRRHLRRLPEHNPLLAFRDRMEKDAAWLMEAELDLFHAYSFATLRQYGACYELSATFLAWLGAQGVGETEGPRRALEQVSQGTKALQFQLARAMARKRPVDLAPLTEMARLWDQAMTALVRDHG